MMDDIYWRDEKVEVAPAVDWSVLGNPIEPGIYFGLPEQEYRAACGLNASLFKLVETSPMTAWGECIDQSGMYRAEDTDAQDEGTALHKRLLEGEAAFAERCAVIPENDGSWIEGVAELKARCEELKIKKGGSTDELCKRILEHDPDAKLWSVHIREFLAENNGKILLKAEIARQMELKARLVMLNPEIKNAFKGGFPEVSIFWIDERGMPCKARVDYLKTITAIDLKYFANIRKRPIPQAVNMAIEDHRLQARHYMDGMVAAKALAKDGHVYGGTHDADMPSDTWVQAFIEAPARFSWVFIQKGKIPEIEAVEFCQREREGASENAYWTNGTDRIHFAKNTIHECLKTYGATPWVMERAPRRLRDEDQRLSSLN